MAPSLRYRHGAQKAPGTLSVCGTPYVVRHAARRGIVVLVICAGVATASAGAGAQGRPDSSSVMGSRDSSAAMGGAARAGDSAGVGGLSLLPAAVASGSHLYELIPEESDDIRSAIDASTAHMNFIIRPIARHRLSKANRRADHLEFEAQSDTLAVTFDEMNPILTPLNGDSTPWKRGGTHEWYQVRMVPSGDTLRQIIKTDDGQRENDFVFLDDGARVALHVILTADRLPIPLQYTLLYRREY
jgi:hypothetical protein